jgi:predicted DNA-binding protein (MmcQ/YjbR family)
MDIESIRHCCLALPRATESVQWGYALCFKVDGKLFAVTRLEPGEVRLSFKASAENFMELCERPGIIPAPYLARAQWVGLQELNALPDSELRELLAEAYRLVFERLPRKRQAELQTAALKSPTQSTTAKRKSVKGTPAKAAKKKPAKKKSVKAGRRK